jgi:hypothetical protein
VNGALLERAQHPHDTCTTPTVTGLAIVGIGVLVADLHTRASLVARDRARERWSALPSGQ